MNGITALKRFIVSFVLIILFFVLQTTVFQWISFGGIVPNLLIILSSTYGFMRGDRVGLLMGLCCGLLADIFFGSFIGLNAILFMYIGYLNGKFHQVFYPEEIKLPFILIISSDFVYLIIYYILMFLLRGRFDFSYYFVKIIIPEVVYTGLVTLIVYPLLLFIHKKLTQNIKKRGMKFV